MTRTDTIIPTMPPIPIPELFSPPLSLDEPLSRPELWLGFARRPGGVLFDGGGGVNVTLN